MKNSLLTIILKYLNLAIHFFGMIIFRLLFVLIASDLHFDSSCYPRLLLKTSSFFFHICIFHLFLFTLFYTFQELPFVAYKILILDYVCLKYKIFLIRALKINFKNHEKILYFEFSVFCT